MSSVKQLDLPQVDIRPMHELDVPLIVAIERAAYQFPWSEGIFRDDLSGLGVNLLCNARTREPDRRTIRRESKIPLHVAFVGHI